MSLNKGERKKKNTKVVCKLHTKNTIMFLLRKKKIIQQKLSPRTKLYLFEQLRKLNCLMVCHRIQGFRCFFITVSLYTEELLSHLCISCSVYAYMYVLAQEPVFVCVCVIP